MGVGTHSNGFWVGSHYQVWRFDNYLSGSQSYQKHDALYVPSMSFTTGDIDIHDIHMRADTPVFVATRFNCLAELAPGRSFRAIWRPNFIDKFVAEDRCHLNGLALEDGQPRYVTCVAETNVADGWRAHRRDGGLVIDVSSGETITAGLSMPHSPRLYNGDLWIIQSGTGELGRIDSSTGKFEPVCFLPGFARGLSIHGDRAIIGVSLPRDKTGVFKGLELEDRLKRNGDQPRCMIAVINLKTGVLEHHIDIGPPISEIYDVAVLQGVVNPYLLGLQKKDIQFVVNPDLGPFAQNDPDQPQ
jgi:uncharacterized protein (TIGR03032 family)